MNDYIRDFQDRVEEVEKYFDFVKKIDSIETHKQEILQLPNGQTHFIDSPLQKILRTNCFLMLYNLVESSIRNGIIAIYDAIHDESLSYKSVNSNIKEIWLTYKFDNLTQSSVSKKTVTESLTKVIDDVINEEPIFFDKEKLPISGNLDREHIQKLRDQYKFYGRLRNDNDRLSYIMGQIKKMRNDIAHGNISFTKATKDITINTLIEFKDESIKYLEDILSNIDEFIVRKKYLI
ncbi:Uncharacterized protein dnl_21670 [Desulfonema limicola]|uniref:MAE-28990/MAE-18760-like HEPN domain-containing protein n=1 Tax=Desulfonema limicola TaxID=45656 RepID=A0A975B6T7_9BACT|nr:MAE_28990/MAE_18760 family HEPN-like nuclease [Desulfonema limicola]QTA79885.1 Uncharacterized protein dnl_21670 [Desulfonema limicola]